MKKKRIVVTAAGLSALMIVAASAANAKPTGNTIYVDGTKINGAAYMINGNNYFKLRDIAAMVNGSEKQFEVSWNQAEKRIDLTTNKAYTVAGGELALPSSTTKTASESKAVVYKDGKKAEYTGYTINDNNYYMLRDLCKDMDIGVTYDANTKRVDILTTVGYGKENEVTTPVEPTPTEPTTPEHPAEEKKIEGDYRQAGDPGILSPNNYYFPSYGNYTKDYQNFLDNCGEEIVTKTIRYYTFCSQTNEKSVLAGFPLEVLVQDSRVTQGDSLASALMLYVDSPTGSFDLKMPKSLYERTIDGEWVFRIKGAITENTNMKTTINGKVYEIAGAKINSSDIRDTKPTRVQVELRYYAS